MNAVLSPAALRRKARLDSLAAIEFPADLPVVQKREDLARAIADNQVVIVCGETGSGKTTQLPKICLTLGRGVLGCIGHTQPRRVAARTVATRIAFELKTELGGAVGYKVRFHDKVSPDTSVKLMTDGILLAEIHSDPLLGNYDTLIIDEAHERSLNIDFLLGYLKQLLPRRPDLKLIITSATLDADRFAKHFTRPFSLTLPREGGGNGAPPSLEERGVGGEGESATIIQVSGRSYPVETRYRPLQVSEEGEAQDVTKLGNPLSSKLDVELTLPQAVSSALDELAAGGLRGDVLVFLPGEREIRDTAETLRKHHPKGIEVLPLFARLSAAEQDRVFKTGAGRRVVLATNVAETSLTVPNIGYVIDCGLARVNRYSIRQKVEQLHIEKISRAAANQRAGRCGRVMSGVCVRLYDEADFLQRAEFTDPEIFRVSLATVILRMSALELGEISEFPFIEPPTPRMIADGYQLLSELNAIDDTRKLTPLGHELAKLPLDPKIARLLLAGRQYHCLTEILIIASALSVQDPRERPLDRQEAADAAHKRFADERSDFLAYPKIWAWFEQALADKKSNRLLAEECRRNFLSQLRLREWRELHQQLHAQVAEMGMLKNSLSRRERGQSGGELGVIPSPPGGGLERGAVIAQPATYEQIHKALLCGLLGNIGMKSVESNEYLGARGIKFFIAPNSVLAKKGAKWVMAGELIETHRLYARTVARIEPEWLEETGGHLIKRHYYDPHWEKRAAQVVAYERSTLHGLLLNAKKRVHYGPINVAESREVFIRQALVGGEFETHAPFFAHNRKLIADIEALEHKSRRPDVLVDEELIFAFYDSRIPGHFSGHGLHNGATFEAWRKEAEHKDPKLLYLKKDDLMRHEAAGITTDQYPPQLKIDNVSFALGYNFSPGRNDDGITLTVPLALINQVSAARCEWLIPGILAEKVTQLIKTLQQRLRRHLVPVPEFAAAFCREVPASNTPLLQALARYIREQKQVDVPLDAFRLEQLPPHLLMNFRVVDEHGRQLGMSRNFAQLHAELAPRTAPSLIGSLASSPPKGEGLKPRAVQNSPLSPRGRAGVGEGTGEERYTSWSFGAFAETSVVKRAGQSVTLFNALADDGDAVVLRAFDTRDVAQAAHRGGLRRLFMLLLKEQVKYLEKNLPDAQRLGMLFMAPNSPFAGTQQELQQQILAMTFERCCLNDPLPANEVEFTARGKEAKNRLLLIAQELARLVGNVLTEYQAVQKNLPQLKAHAQASQDVRAQLEWLLHKRFIADTPYERLQHVPRYLKAINLRIEKLRANPARDAQCIAQMQPLTQAWQKLRQVQQGNSDPRVEEFAWMLQELRVSLFAQELKTPVIVSVKRLEKMLAGIRN